MGTVDTPLILADQILTLIRGAGATKIEAYAAISYCKRGPPGDRRYYFSRGLGAAGSFCLNISGCSPRVLRNQFLVYLLPDFGEDLGFQRAYLGAQNLLEIVDPFVYIVDALIQVRDAAVLKVDPEQIAAHDDGHGPPVL